MNKIETDAEGKTNAFQFKNFDLKFNSSDYDLIIVPFYTDEYVLKNFTNIHTISLASIICETPAKYNLPYELDNAQLKKIKKYIKDQYSKTQKIQTRQIKIGFIELPMQYSKISEQLISLNLDLIFLSHTKKDPIKNISYNTKFEQVQAVKKILHDNDNYSTNIIIGADDQAFLDIFNSFDQSNTKHKSLKTIWQTQLGQQIYRSAQYIVYNDEEFLKYFNHCELDIDGLKNLGYYLHDMRPDMVLEAHLSMLNVDRSNALQLKQSFVNYMLNCMEIRHNYICILTHWLQNIYNVFYEKHSNKEQKNFIFPIHTLRLITTVKNTNSNESIILSGFTQSDSTLPFTEQAIRYTENAMLIRNHSYIEAVSKFIPKAEKKDSEIRCIEPAKTDTCKQKEVSQNPEENKTFCTYIYSVKQFIKQQKDMLKLDDYIKVIDPEEENIKFHLHKIFFQYISKTKDEIAKDSIATSSNLADTNLFVTLFHNLSPYKQTILALKWRDIKKHYDNFLQENNNLSEKYSSKLFYINCLLSPRHNKESSEPHNIQIEARIDCILNDNNREKFTLIELETSKKPILTEEIALKFFIAQQRLQKYKTNAQITLYILNPEGIHEIKTEAIIKKAKKILVTD